MLILIPSGDKSSRAPSKGIDAHANAGVVFKRDMLKKQTFKLAKHGLSIKKSAQGEIIEL
jgi:hypothetical protein